MPPERSVSSSRQFIVYGPDVRSRGAICDLAENVKREILQLIGQRDEWRTPIVIDEQYLQVNPPGIPYATVGLSQTGVGLKLQLNVALSSEVALTEVRRELLNVVLLEMMYRSVPDLPAGSNCTPPPEWLLDGLQGPVDAIACCEGTPATASKIFSLEEFLRQRPNSLDALGRSLYRAYSRALVDLLVHLPDGRHRLARFILDLPSAPSDESAHLRMHFPELFDAMGSSQKMWLSQITRLSTGQSSYLLGWEESERILNELLSSKFPGDHGGHYPLQQFPLFIRDVSARSALVRLRQDLIALMLRTNPVYRPVISEYERIANLLARGKTNGIAKRLGRLTASRQALAAQMQQIGDYMNWFEATKSPGQSGFFVEYLKTADLADSACERHRDPISVYLDMLEIQFQE